MGEKSIVLEKYISANMNSFVFNVHLARAATVLLLKQIMLCTLQGGPNKAQHRCMNRCFLRFYSQIKDSNSVNPTNERCCYASVKKAETIQPFHLVHTKCALYQVGMYKKRRSSLYTPSFAKLQMLIANKQFIHSSS